MCGGIGLPPEAIAKQLLTEAGLACGLGAMELERALESGWAAGFKRPHWPFPEGRHNQMRCVYEERRARQEHDGFRFRSRAEVFVHRALKKKRILSSPLPVGHRPVQNELASRRTSSSVTRADGWS